MLEVNATLIVLVISFLIFMKLLDLVYVKPVAKVMEARDARIESDLAESRKLQEEATTVLAGYQTHLAEVRAKAQATINDAVTASQKSRNAEMEKVQAEGRKRVEQARTALAKEKDELIAGLVDSEIQIVDTIMTKLIGKSGISLDRGTVKKAIEEAC